MFNHYFLAFDVGGLFIRGGVLNENGDFLTDTLSYYPANSGADQEELLSYFADIIAAQISKIMDKSFVIDGIGFAFPGPFDYENGICLIHGVNKFDSLYGLNLRTELMKYFKKKNIFNTKVSPLFRIIFENNVNMFALGEWFTRSSAGYNRILFLTIGNGTGSAFLENGHVIKNRKDVPENGWVYNMPFKDSIVDDYISTRGILTIARQLKVAPNSSLDKLADMAHSGNRDVKHVFYRFGHMLGEMLLKYTKQFQPNAIVIGGQISKSYDLYREHVEFSLKNESVDILLSNETSHSTFIGLSKMINKA